MRRRRTGLSAELSLTHGLSLTSPCTYFLFYFHQPFAGKVPPVYFTSFPSSSRGWNNCVSILTTVFFASINLRRKEFLRLPPLVCFPIKDIIES